MKTKKPYFLVAEDDPDDQFLIKEMMDDYCLQLDTRFLQNGEELMRFLEDETENPVLPNLVVMDLNMPCKDGRTALAEIRTHPRLKKLPVVVLTTSADERDARFCQKQGVFGFFTKPASVEEFRAIIRKLCVVFAGR